MLENFKKMSDSSSSSSSFNPILSDIRLQIEYKKDVERDKDMPRDKLAENLQKKFERYRVDADSILAEVGGEEKVDKYKNYYESLKEDYPDLFERTVPSNKPDQPPIPELVARIMEGSQPDSLKLDSLRPLPPEEQKNEYEIILRQAIDKMRYLRNGLKKYKLESDNKKLLEENERLKNDLLQQSKDPEASEQKEIEHLIKEKDDKIEHLKQEIIKKNRAIRELRQKMSNDQGQMATELFELEESKEAVIGERNQLKRENIKLQMQFNNILRENITKDDNIQNLQEENKYLTDKVRMLEEGEEIQELRRHRARQLIEQDSDYKELDNPEKQKMEEFIMKGMANVQNIKIEGEKYKFADKNTTEEFKGITPKELDDGSLEIKTEMGSAFYFNIDANEQSITTTSSLKVVQNDLHLSDARVLAWDYTLGQAGKKTEDTKPSKFIGKDVLHGPTNNVMSLFIREKSKSFKKGDALYYAFMATSPGKANMFSLTQHPNKMGKRDIVRGSIAWTEVEWVNDKVLQITCELQ